MDNSDKLRVLVRKMVEGLIGLGVSTSNIRVILTEIDEETEHEAKEAQNCAHCKHTRFVCDIGWLAHRGAEVDTESKCSKFCAKVGNSFCDKASSSFDAVVKGIKSVLPGYTVIDSVEERLKILAQETQNTKENVLPPGEYVISDPCYVLKDKDYKRFLKDTDSCKVGGVFVDSKTGLKFAVFSTAYGDGCYLDNIGREYGVDAGMIGCIPVAMCSKKLGKYSHKERSQVDFKVGCDGKDSGHLHFGNLTIDTVGDLFNNEEEE